MFLLPQQNCLLRSHKAQFSLEVSLKCVLCDISDRAPV